MYGQNCVAEKIENRTKCDIENNMTMGGLSRSTAGRQTGSLNNGHSKSTC